MNAKPVDVLAVMAEAAALLRNEPAVPAVARAVDEARAAVAELIEVVKLARAEMAHKAGCGRVRPTTEWAEHGSWNYEGCCCDIKRVDAALARCGGQP